MTLTGLAFRNLTRNKVRTGLTILGVAVAVVTFLLLRTVVAAWTGGADYAAKDRVVTRHKVTFVMQLPKKYVEQIKQVPGVTNASWCNWFGGKDPSHEREFFGTFACDVKSYFSIYTEQKVPPEQLAAFLEDKTGAVVGEALAHTMGWKVGQTVTLESGIYPNQPDKPWTFTIRGIYTTTSRNVDKQSFFFHWDYMNDGLPDARKDEVGWVMSRIDSAGHAADVGVAIDKLFDDKDTQTLSQDEHSFQAGFLAGFSAVLRIFDIVSLAILVIMLLILGNTIAMGVRERTNEFATMRALGFLPGHLRNFVLGEAAVLGMLGGAAGLAFAFWLVQGLLGKFLENNFGNLFPVFRLPAIPTVGAFGLAIALGVLAAVLPARTAARVKVTDALRKLA
jgi:putative ABC transport system permease protein